MTVWIPSLYDISRLKFPTCDAGFHNTPYIIVNSWVLEKFPRPWDFEILHKISQFTLLRTFVHNLPIDAVHVIVTVEW